MSEMMNLTAPLRDLYLTLKPYRHDAEGNLRPEISTACKQLVALTAVAEEFERQAQELFLNSLESVKQGSFGGRLHISRANHKAMNHILPLGPAQDASEFGANVVVVDFGVKQPVPAPVMPDGGSAA